MTARCCTTLRAAAAKAARELLDAMRGRLGVAA